MGFCRAVERMVAYVSRGITAQMVDSWSAKRARQSKVISFASWRRNLAVSMYDERVAIGDFLGTFGIFNGGVADDEEEGMVLLLEEEGSDATDGSDA